MRAAAAFVVAGFLAVPALASAQNCTSDARQVVDAIYRQVLERGANGGEANTWINQLSGGQTTVRELVENIAASPEHRQRFLPGESEGSRRNAVTTLYRHLLGREPDPGGLQAHVDLHNRNDIDAVIASLISSAEYQQKYGENVVPGQNVRYCANSVERQCQFRFRNMDRNGNNQIERNEWNGSAAVVQYARLEPGRRAVEQRGADGRAPLAERRRRLRSQRAGDLDARARSGGSTATTTAGSCPTSGTTAPEYFRRADRDRNGALSQTEFVNNATWDDDRDDRFENLDMNNNGRVERGEWHGSADAFQWLDRNNDNVLSQAEVVGDGSTQFDSFGSLDRNDNGRLEHASGSGRWRASPATTPTTTTSSAGRSSPRAAARRPRRRRRQGKLKTRRGTLRPGVPRRGPMTHTRTPSWTVGDHLTHRFNPELGVGRVTAVDGRSLVAEFPRSGTTLRLAAGTDALVPVDLGPGRPVRVSATREETRVALQLPDGRLQLANGRAEPAHALWPLELERALLDRLALGDTDEPGDLLIRLDILHLRRVREADGLGSFLGGRVRLFPHQLHVAERATHSDPVRWLLADEVGLGQDHRGVPDPQPSRAQRGRSSAASWWRRRRSRCSGSASCGASITRSSRCSTTAASPTSERDFGAGFNPFELHRRAVIALETLQPIGRS